MSIRSLFTSHEKLFSEWMMQHEFNGEIEAQPRFPGHNPSDVHESYSTNWEESSPVKPLKTEEFHKKWGDRFDKNGQQIPRSAEVKIDGTDQPVRRAKKPNPSCQSVERKDSSGFVKYGNFEGRTFFAVTKKQTGYFLVDGWLVVSVPQNPDENAFEIDSDAEITAVHKFDGVNDPVSSGIAKKVQNWFAWERSKLSNVFKASLGIAVMLSLSVIALGEQEHLAGQLLSRAFLIGSIAMQSMVLYAGCKFYHLYLLEEKMSIKDLGQWVWQVRKAAQAYPLSTFGAPIDKFFTPKELAGLDYLRTNTLQFLRLGAEAPFVQRVKSEKYPYSVSRNPDAPADQMNSLQNRVQLDSPNVAIVDKLFRVQYKDDAPQDFAVKTWSHLSWNCQKIQAGSGILAIGLTLLSLQDFPIYAVAALYVGTVASTCLFGWCLHRTHIAEKQLSAWQRPGEIFAQRRKADLELPLAQIIQKKCHFHPDQPTGTLLGAEILSIFKREFKKFAEPLLDRKCETPKQQHQWVVDFFQNNPFAVKFFEENPQLANEAGWKEIQTFQKQSDQLLKVMRHLYESYANDPKRQEAAKQKYKAIETAYVKKSRAYFEEKKKIPFLYANLYFERVFKVLKAECLDPIEALIQHDLAKASAFGSLIYPQVRAFLEEAHKGLVQDHAYTLEVIGDPATFVPGNYQQELDAITANFPQKVIDKAKAIAPEERYQNFVAAAFA